MYCLKLSTWKIYHFSSIYLFFQSFLYINMDSYLFYTLGYNPVYFFINFVPYFFLVLGTINSHNGLPCPFDVSPSLCVCVCVCEVLRLILYSSCLSSTRISHFSQHLQLLVLENGIRNQDLGAKHSWILT